MRITYNYMNSYKVQIKTLPSKLFWLVIEYSIPVAGQEVAGQGKAALSCAILFYFTLGTD